MRLITAKNVRERFISLDPEEFLPTSLYQGWMTRGIPSLGDVLFTTEAPLGNAAVVTIKETFALAQRVICFQLYGRFEAEYLTIVVSSRAFRTILEFAATGLTAKGIKAAKLKRLPIPVPPLSEQHRIVAKVDELMALCDELEAAQTKREHRRDRLVAATLPYLSNDHPAPAAEPARQSEPESSGTGPGFSSKQEEGAHLAARISMQDAGTTRAIASAVRSPQGVSPDSPVAERPTGAESGEMSPVQGSPSTSEGGSSSDPNPYSLTPNPLPVVPNPSAFYLRHMAKLTTKPHHIKQLRQTILNLAVQGKLGHQDPADEPASKLLTAGVNLPEGFRRRRKIFKQGNSAASESIWSRLPGSWRVESVQGLYEMNAIVDFADGNHGSLYPRSSEFSDCGVDFVTAKDLANGKVVWASCAKLTAQRARQLTKGWAKGGDVLLTHNATVGRVAIVDPEIGSFLLGTSVTYYRLNPSVFSPQYFFRFLQSSLWQSQMEAIMAQTTRNQVSIQKQALFAIVIPPLAEQHRIVAKVNALMALCDELETTINQATTTRTALLESVLSGALNRSLLGLSSRSSEASKIKEQI